MKKNRTERKRMRKVASAKADRPRAGRYVGDTAAGSMSRRSFLGGLGGATAATATVGLVGLPSLLGPTSLNAGEVAPQSSADRREAAFRVRQDAAQLAFDRPYPEQRNNGEEEDYGGTRIANFSKGLPCNEYGEVDLSAYDSLLAAVASGQHEDFEAIPLGGVRKLRNPQAGLGFDLEGPDSHHVTIRPAPRVDGAENSAEMGELYWMALARDVSFTDYAENRIIAAAAADLSKFSDFRGPTEDRRVTPATIFRGNTPGDLTGPYLSQFLLLEIPYGSLTISQRQKTVLGAAAGGADYLIHPEAWLSSQRGGAPSESDRFDPTPRYIRNGRDLGQYVHVDALYEAYLNACLILLGMGAPFDPGNPYRDSVTQDAFGTFGSPHILSLVTEVATRALKAVWYQKWFVHRRLRPEAFSGRVHFQITENRYRRIINSEILNCAAVHAIFRRYGTYLLPQAFPEGSPMHPAYGAGHAIVAGACVTVLKAWFDEPFVIADPVVPNSDGTRLVQYEGPPLTVGGELNKVAANIAMGRNFAGIHWRTDYSESLELGEEVAIGLLEEQRATYNEAHSFTLTKFDGTEVSI